MMALHRRPPTLTPPALTAAELARMARWKRIDAVGAAFKIDCWRDAERLTNQFDFVRWRLDRDYAVQELRRALAAGRGKQ